MTRLAILLSAVALSGCAMRSDDPANPADPGPMEGPPVADESGITLELVDHFQERSGVLRVTARVSTTRPDALLVSVAQLELETAEARLLSFSPLESEDCAARLLAGGVVECRVGFVLDPGDRATRLHFRAVDTTPAISLSVAIPEPSFCAGSAATPEPNGERTGACNACAACRDHNEAGDRAAYDRCLDACLPAAPECRTCLAGNAVLALRGFDSGTECTAAAAQFACEGTVEVPDGSSCPNLLHCFLDACTQVQSGQYDDWYRWSPHALFGCTDL